MPRFIALLRAVNVGGRQLPMARLRALCADLGWEDARTYIQSGNLLFSAAGETGTLEAALEGAIGKSFGFDVPVVVRTGRQWAALAGANPFAEAEPNRLLLYVSKKPPLAGAAALLAERALAGERIEAAGGALWIHYPEGIARSKLTPAVIDRAIGSAATGRNYRTVITLKEMLE